MHNFKYWVFSFFVFISLVGSTFAECPQFYPGEKVIQPFGALEICNSFFVTQYDDSNKRALFSSELLAPSGHNVVRKNAFHADKRSTDPVKPQEYYGTKKDKGHLVPADDATNDQEMLDTFNMTNMTPQDPKLNRGPWKTLEGQTRKYVELTGQPTHVVTGALYESQEKMGRVPVPTGYFKIIYIVGKAPIAYYADNNEVSKPQRVQISWINTKTNLKFPQ